MWTITKCQYPTSEIEISCSELGYGSILTPESVFASNTTPRTVSLGPDTPEAVGPSAIHQNLLFGSRAGSGCQTGTKHPHLLLQKPVPTCPQDPN